MVGVKSRMHAYVHMNMHLYTYFPRHVTEKPAHSRVKIRHIPHTCQAGEMYKTLIIITILEVRNLRDVATTK